VSTM